MWILFIIFLHYSHLKCVAAHICKHPILYNYILWQITKWKSVPQVYFMPTRSQTLVNVALRRGMHCQVRHRKVTLLNTEHPFYIYSVASPWKPCHFKNLKCHSTGFVEIWIKKFNETEVRKYISPPFTLRSSSCWFGTVTNLHFLSLNWADYSVVLWPGVNIELSWVIKLK